MSAPRPPPGSYGPAARAYHAGELLGAAVDFDFHLYRTEDLLRRFRGAGFVEVDAAERGPYPEVEYQGHRTYVSGVNR